MATETVYRSDHPEVLAWWTALESDREAFRVRCTEISDRFPGFTAVISETSKGAKLVGINGRDPETRQLLPPPSPAWRLMTKDLFHYRPYRNHLKDPELVAEFGSVGWKVTDPPGGMPLEVMVESRWYTPGMQMIEGAVWITWGVGQGYIDPDPELADKVSVRGADGTAVDHDMWEPAKLSEYFAAQGN